MNHVSELLMGWVDPIFLWAPMGHYGLSMWKKDGKIRFLSIFYDSKLIKMTQF
jgi:hypothetical protein